ncbi:MAG: hypothetical protein JST46_06725 [Bacteroidetes bacterium]|nr:hypothetical protein [Bacteroidota bacterium]
MMKNWSMLLGVLLVISCSQKEKYDVSRYYNPKEQDKILTNIVTYIFSAPPYTKMADRFQPQHKTYYSSINFKFQIEKYFISDEGIHYFYVIRPAPGTDKRGVGGHFRMDKDFNISEFREEFVTPALPESEVKGRCAFMFDEMIKHNLGQYLKMESFVQWPNPISYYDTVTYEWKMKPGYEEAR